MGALLYELLAGRSPSPATTPLQIFANVMTQPPIPLPRVGASCPRRSRRSSCAACAGPREDRYASMGALAAALRAVIADGA